jgi:hypothetical protein
MSTVPANVMNVTLNDAFDRIIDEKLKAPEVGVKYDAGKLEWSLLPMESAEEIIKVLMFGSKKYAPDNWKKIEGWDRRYFDAALRHMSAWKQGEKVDSETGITHIAHAACCLMFIISKELENDRIRNVNSISVNSK